ncbi:CPBP family intramembrane glutamic endopeptidase [Alteromonas confluentis]|uniref:Intracellular septation protein n=1 Tax=Alteromonas confluentis TaxID=1656094 RepID=A0A1E7ZFW6_9ALTE|nr:CPBP family intramembrane glutamic endopeptidase [Alteromonas confluentis]OFC72396.1 intracellular septation protein [Alteromonas confluentis]
MRLWIEMVLLFFALPVAIAYWVNQVADYLMPLLGAVGIACLAVLLADKQFKRFRLWHWQDFFTHLRTTLKMFIPWACLLAAVVYLIKPELFLQWPLQEPELWVLTLLIYPIVSVIPQEIIFRTFFFHRYKQILPSKMARWGLSTFVFGLVHLVYGNWVAMVLSWIGGALFGYRYMQTRSTPVVVVEHAIWGSFIFTVGLGSYLVISPP